MAKMGEKMSYTQGLIAGTTERIWREYRNILGATADPSYPHVNIYSPAGILYASATPTKYSVGLYYYDFTVNSTATPGLYAAWWSGVIEGATLNMDSPQYLQVIYRPWSLTDYTGIIGRVRRNIGDIDPDNYRIQPVDMMYYVKDAIDTINSRYNFGYSATITNTGLSFTNSTTLVTDSGKTALTLYSMQTVYDIVNSDLNYNSVNVGSFNVGDVSINLSAGSSVKKQHLRDLKEYIDEILREVITTGQQNGGRLIDTFYNEGKPYLTSFRTD